MTFFNINEFGNWSIEIMETKGGFGNKQEFTGIIIKTLLKWNNLATFGSVLLHEGYC